jgi:hypothetical protein
MRSIDAINSLLPLSVALAIVLCIVEYFLVTLVFPADRIGIAGPFLF